MEKVIFDTSVWIDYGRGLPTRQSQLLESYMLHSADNLFLTPTILQEILQGVRNEHEFYYKKSVLESYNILQFDWQKSSVLAAKLYFDLRKKGITIRKSNDCLIAAVAIENDVLLVHNDSDFELIAQNSALRTYI